MGHLTFWTFGLIMCITIMAFSKVDAGLSQQVINDFLIIADDANRVKPQIPEEDCPQFCQDRQDRNTSYFKYKRYVRSMALIGPQGQKTDIIWPILICIYKLDGTRPYRLTEKAYLWDPYLSARVLYKEGNSWTLDDV